MADEIEMDLKTLCDALRSRGYRIPSGISSIKELIIALESGAPARRPGEPTPAPRPRPDRRLTRVMEDGSADGVMMSTVEFDGKTVEVTAGVAEAAADMGEMARTRPQ